MKKLLLTGACLLGLAVSQTASAITYNLNYEFSEGTSPSGPTPWVVIDITDVLEGVQIKGVQIKINNSGLTGVEFNSDTYLNVADAFVGTLTFGSPTKDGTFADPTISQGLNAFKADGDGKFDIKFEFATAAADRFGAGESITYLVTSSVSGLDATDFDLTSVVGGGQGVWHAAAHIQGIGISGTESGWIGDKQIVPDGGFTATLLGLGMLGLSFLARRKA